MTAIFIFFEFIVFVLGLSIGSFLNCVIFRLEQEKSLNGRSFCPSCRHQLSWRDLFPVFSFLFLGGKCRYCKTKISIQYPLVELATGMIFLLIFNFQFSIFNKFFNPSISQFLILLFLFYIASVLIVIFVYDLKHYIIPDKILFPAVAITVVFRLLELFNFKLISNFKFQISNFAPMGGYLLAVIIASGFFLVIFLLSKGAAMGFGDVKLAVLLGLLLGFPNILVGLFLTFLLGAAVGLALMVSKKKGLKSEMPFGPFLIAGAFIALFWGQEIINWYLHFLMRI